MVFCGHDGYALKCIRKRTNAHAYYACRARVDKNYQRKGKNCNLPFVRANLLETAVWEKLKEVLSDREKLRDAVGKALADLEAKRTSIGVEALAINKKLDVVRGRKERLGLAFVDGTVNDDRYKQTLAKLDKEEAGLLKTWGEIDPNKMEDLAALEAHIASIKEFLGKGDFVVRDSGLYAIRGSEYLPVGFNAFRASDGKLALGEIRKKDSFVSMMKYPMSPENVIDLPTTWTTIPPGTIQAYTLEETVDPLPFREGIDQAEAAVIARNKRALMQLFNIQVFVFGDKAEIRGIIPPQLIDLKHQKPKMIAPIIDSGRGPG